MFHLMILKLARLVLPVSLEYMQYGQVIRSDVLVFLIYCISAVAKIWQSAFTEINTHI